MGATQPSGTDSPADLVATAAAAGLDVVALTDHDTTGGWAAAWAARPPGLTIVPGMELSCRYFPTDEPPIAVHLLAYLFDPLHPAFAAERVRLREERLNRGERIAAGLADDERSAEFVDLVTATEARVLTMLDERKPGRRLHTNVELYAGVVMALCGLPRELFTPTFAVARVIGWSANVLEQAMDSKIIRPSARYVGPPPPQPVPPR